MKPVKFKGCNAEFAKDQPPYLSLPALKMETERGEVISCWQLTWREKLIILFTGRIFFLVWTFNGKLQPQRPYAALGEMVHFKKKD